MEINLNPGRATDPVAGQAIQRPPAAKPADTETFARSQALESIRNETSAVRPDQVARARALVANVKYPPDELLNGIAHLLAVNFKNE
jgi:hypothetical protein